MTNVEQQFQTLTAEELMDVNGGRWQCTVGTVGMAVTTAIMAPPGLWAVGYWGGAAVGAATFC